MNRILKTNDICELLNCSKTSFYTKRNRLEKSGFPIRDKDLSGWDALAVTKWLDHRSNITSESSEEMLALEVARGNAHA